MLVFLELNVRTSTPDPGGIGPLSLALQPQAMRMWPRLKMTRMEELVGQTESRREQGEGRRDLEGTVAERQLAEEEVVGE